METLVHEMKIEELRIKLGFSCKFTVNSIDHSGGLAMLWDSSLSCSISGFSNNHIDLIITESTGDWRLTGYYGFLERHKRRASWTLLRALAIRSSLPWVCIGDFNDLLSPSDKKEGVAHPNWFFHWFHCGDPRARSDPVGGFESKPWGRPVTTQSLYQNHLSNTHGSNFNLGQAHKHLQIQ